MLNVLLLAANPEVPRLRLDTELRVIQDALARGSKRDRFAVHLRTDVRWRDLRDAILEVKPAILQFSGHARAGDLMLTDDVGGIAREVPLEALHALLGAGLDVRVLVLNACDTAGRLSTMTERVHQAIGMRGQMSDDGAVMFADGFYSALARGYPVAHCMAVVRAELI